MKHMLKTSFARPLALYLVFALILISSAAGPAEAMLLPASMDASPSPDRTADLAKVQKVLESKELRQRLIDHGLTADEVEARISTLSDEQLHRIASNLDAVQAGGDAASALLSIIIIALLVVLIIFLLEGRIEIKKK